jgi:hypothetical protein
VGRALKTTLRFAIPGAIAWSGGRPRPPRAGGSRKRVNGSCEGSGSWADSARGARGRARAPAAPQALRASAPAIPMAEGSIRQDAVLTGTAVSVSAPRPRRESAQGPGAGIGALCRAGRAAPRCAAGRRERPAPASRQVFPARLTPPPGSPGARASPRMGRARGVVARSRHGLSDLRRRRAEPSVSSVVKNKSTTEAQRTQRGVHRHGPFPAVLCVLCVSVVDLFFTTEETNCRPSSRTSRS